MSVVLFLFVCLSVVLPVTPFNIAHHLGTKTPYILPPSNISYTPPDDQCSLVHMNLIARHGTRDPTSGSLDDYEDLKKKISKVADFIPHKYSWLADWSDPFVEAEAGFLVVPGEEEHYYLAKRAVANFPELMNQTYLPDIYSMQCTQVLRTCSSGSSFAFGAFEGRGDLGSSKFQPIAMTSTSQDIDYELRFFDTCPTYTKEVKENPAAHTVFNEFNHNVLSKVAEEVTERLNLTGVWDVSVSDTQYLWELCGYDISLYNESSRFCSLFTEDEHLALEYSEDLKNYYEKGYGYKINYEIATDLLRDIVHKADDVATGKDENLSGSWRFAHAETIIPLACILGLFKETDNSTLLANRSYTAPREFSVAKIAPFAGNAQLLLYNCSGTFKVKMLWNELEVVMPGCDGELYCDWEGFKKYNHKAIYGHLDLMCDITDDATCKKDVEHFAIWASLAAAATLLLMFVLGMLVNYFRGKRGLAAVPCFGSPEKEVKFTPLDSVHSE